jgi:nucleoside-diphosphate-sugar epimerase
VIGEVLDLRQHLGDDLCSTRIPWPSCGESDVWSGGRQGAVCLRSTTVRGVRILVVGGAGMVGRKLAERLVRHASLGAEPVSHLSLVDIVEPERPGVSAFGVDTLVADMAEPGVAGDLVCGRPDVIFHLAAVLSGEAEAEFEKGYRVNLDGTRFLLDGVRAVGRGYCPRVVFASSIAVFGAPLPAVIGDDQCLTPLTSYGTQKAVGELLLSDYTRRGFLDGVGVRLPTICVRPGKPNQAASGFFSSIIREPLNGEEAVLPVPDDIRHWHASPRAAVGFLVHAAKIDGGALGDRRCLTMPGVSVTVAEQIAALRRIAGEEVVRRIRREPDETVLRIVGGWPGNFDARRASALGFRAEADFDEIIRVHVEDELGGRIAAGRS